jgi:hypothetical protein
MSTGTFVDPDSAIQTNADPDPGMLKKFFPKDSRTDSKLILYFYCKFYKLKFYSTIARVANTQKS